MANSSKALFLSYASQDAHAARRICDALRAAGLEVWFDQSDLRGGEAWDAAIRKQVKECALFMPLISANTEARSEGYFRREWNLAMNRMLDMAEDSAFLVPIIVDDTPESGARVPERFRERQWTRLPGGVAPAEFAERIRTLLVGAMASDSPTRGTSVPLATNPRTPADEGFWVAVLPFKCGGSNTDLTALTDALSEDITTGLSRFSYLRVISRSLTSGYATATTDLRTIGREIGARYVMEGGLRLAGSRLRLAVQLIDTVTGAHLWAESYERTFSPEALFDLQDDLVPRIVSTVADMFGVLPHSMSEAIHGKEPGTLTPYEAVLRSFSYAERVTAEEHAVARASLERVLRQVPGYADGWIMLSMVYCDEYSIGCNPLPESLARAEDAARRAVDAAPGNHRAYFS